MNHHENTDVIYYAFEGPSKNLNRVVKEDLDKGRTVFVHYHRKGEFSGLCGDGCKEITKVEEV